MTNLTHNILNSDLLTLRAAFVKHGFDLWFVGGCVRDLLTGGVPSDIDLCTDASPDEQLAIYKTEGIKYVETGIQHGTITAIMELDAYEITTLRTEDEHDGRYAKMTYTRDLMEDLHRRDLTINAMALTFDGKLIDPFGGAWDLENHVVRFVGVPCERMQEDYLRILRFFRFLGRYGFKEAARGMVMAASVEKCVKGLDLISAERIWSELKKILAHQSAEWVITLMEEFGVLSAIDFPSPSYHFNRLKRGGCIDPVLLTVACLARPFGKQTTINQVERLAATFKWSSDEKKLALAVVVWSYIPTTTELEYAVVVEGRDKKTTKKVAEFFQMQDAIHHLDAMIMPVFPVTGHDLKAAGMQPGKEIGAKLRILKDSWFLSRYTMSKEDLLALVAI